MQMDNEYYTELLKKQDEMEQNNNYRDFTLILSVNDIYKIFRIDKHCRLSPIAFIPKRTEISNCSKFIKTFIEKLHSDGFDVIHSVTRLTAREHDILRSKGFRLHRVPRDYITEVFVGLP